jgi:hypothetical protein
LEPAEALCQRKMKKDLGVLEVVGLLHLSHHKEAVCF